MTDKSQQLLQAFQLFHKLKFSILLEDINGVEFKTMKGIEICSKTLDSEENGVKISAVTHWMKTPMPAVSRAIKGLETKGFVVRKVNMVDRRNTHVELTDSGKEKLKSTEDTMNVFSERLFQKMEEKEVEEMTRLMKKLFDAAQSELKVFEEEKQGRNQEKKQERN